MTDTALAEPNVSRSVRDDLMQMDVTQAVVELEALIDAVLQAGYLNEVAASSPQAERALLILNVCQVQAERAVELSRLCEELQVEARRSP